MVCCITTTQTVEGKYINPNKINNTITEILFRYLQSFIVLFTNLVSKLISLLNK